MKRISLFMFFAVIMLSFISVQDASAIMISADVQGDVQHISTFDVYVNPTDGKQIYNPYNSVNPNDPENFNYVPMSDKPYLKNGDFIVNFGNSLGSTQDVVGDGLNEGSWWNFSFRGDSNYDAFNASTDPLVSALLTIDLIPHAQFYSSGDGFYIPGIMGVHDINDSMIIATFDDYVTIQLELLGEGEYTSDNILAQYFHDGGYFGPKNKLLYEEGKIPGKYFDDALLLSAQLDLTREFAAIPEPATMLLFGSGLLGVFLRRRRA
ncbi:MAG: PEP-CTERM sorting domain-containing protein [Candidatus Omnitrophica bacterium]|nr:PEP-CTERM sorting domain-containing protein [Candidatus Omnitrophota bacterium]